jgi:hypothetical protein
VVGPILKLTVILTEPWHWRSCENSNFENGKLFTFVDSTIDVCRWFKCLIRSSQTRSWDGKLTFRNFSVTEQGVIVCLLLLFVRINVFRAKIYVNDNKQLFRFFINCAVNKSKQFVVLKIWIFTRTSMSRFRQNDCEWAVGMVQAWMTHQAVADHFNVSKITISMLMIRLPQTSRTNDRPRNGRSCVTSQRQDKHLRLKLFTPRTAW